ncbi:YopX family protein [Lacticaseibacillus chiayiensis]|uniref:YopX family protein n=1 Tax=Lacticaseibacillus chiayiensis TaxID=2100821 RepID=A0ABY6H552_9LACO|nr:YopX family protein [Lacticaseibacillus chiayiensis]UYN55629.1 YopX family protein [Lacticaseibacillus chiayiensis]
MRPIKFRLWNRPLNKMQKVSFLQFWGRGVGLLTSTGDHYQLDPKQGELMQFTGVKDENGREIYEGDIVQTYEIDDDGRPINAVVKYEDHLAGFTLTNEYQGVWRRLDNDYPVIGNIYENPELLEARHD